MHSCWRFISSYNLASCILTSRLLGSSIVAKHASLVQIEEREREDVPATRHSLASSRSPKA